VNTVVNAHAYWTYQKVTKDSVTDKIDMITQVMFEDGKVAAVSTL